MEIFSEINLIFGQVYDEKQTPRIRSVTMGNELPTTTSDTASEKLSGGVGGLLAPFQKLIERLIGLRQRTWSNLLMSFGRELGGWGLSEGV